MTLDSGTIELVRSIYGRVPEELATGLGRWLNSAAGSPPDQLWSERDVVLISYADQVRREGRAGLPTLNSFLLDHRLDELIRCVHLLPFFPYTSDDGFSVVDYLQVDPHCGGWDDIARLGDSFDLMFDLVLNHTSVQHSWFQRFLAGDPQFAEFYHTPDPAADLSAVVRPRASPLLTEFATATGRQPVWTTFSADQVDLNYGNPRVMLAMLQTLVEYARRGARIIRLDAIAYLWKAPGTSCIHLPQTHAAVKLMRAVLDRAAPGTLVLTETNVPHRENLSYFGSGTDEAHLVYQFSLPPLLLDAIHSGDTTILRDWLQSLQLPSAQTTFFNFTASHDGVGVRPLEGLVPASRLDRLVATVVAQGGRVSARRQADGSESPYELNIAYVDAVADAAVVPPAEHARRFLATQALMLSMQGIPAVYFHSLVGTRNDLAGVAESGQNRRINRHKYEREELEQCLSDPHGLPRRIFDGYRHLLRARIRQPALHPSAGQQVLDLPGDGRLGFVRTAPTGERLAVLANLSHQPRTINRRQVPAELVYDELARERCGTDEPILLRPYQVRWLSAEAGNSRASL